MGLAPRSEVRAEGWLRTPESSGPLHPARPGEQVPRPYGPASRRAPPWVTPQQRPARSCARNLLHLVSLNHIAFLDVVEPTQDQTTLEALADLGSVVLLPLERGEVQVVRHDGAVADQAHLGVASDQAAGDHATGDVADLGAAEDRADLRLSQGRLLELRLEHALERGLDLLDGLVDHRVVPDLHTLALGQLRRLALRADVEADDDRVGGRGQVDVGLGDRTDTAVDDAQRHLVAHVDLGQRVLEGLDRTGDVALQDQVELLALALLHRGHEVLQAATHATLGLHGRTLARLSPLGDLAGHPVVLDHDEVLTRPGDTGEAEHHRGPRRVRLVDRLAVLVEHGAHPAVRRTRHDRVADAEGSALDEDRCDRATTTVQVRLDDEALGVLVGVGPQVERGVRSQHDRLEQLVQVELGLGRDVDEHDVAAVLLGDQAVLGQLTAHLGRVGVFLVDLVDRHHDRHVGRLGVVERLDGLRHHTVIRGHDEHRDVGGLRTTGTHGGERLVTGGVDQGDATVVAVDLRVHLVGTDVLRDATGLLVHHVGRAERVEQLGLSVVDVTHHGHDRRTRLEHVLVTFVGPELQVEGVEQLAVLVLGRDDLDDVVELLAEELQRRVVHGLGRGHHLAEVEQHLHQRGRVDADLLGEVGQRGAAGEANGLAVALADADAADRRGLHLLELLTTRALRLASTTRRATGTTERTLGAAATTGTTTTRTTGTTATGRRATEATTGRTAEAATAGSAAGCAAEGGGRLGHHRRVGARHAVAATRRRAGRTLVARARSGTTRRRGGTA